MFNKNDPLIGSVTQVMKENQIIRDVEKAINEEFGIASKRDLPFQVHAEYDALVEEMTKEALVGNQAKLDVNKNNRLDKQDFKALRSMKKKPMEEGKMKDIATDKAEKERLANMKKMEEQQVNTAAKSDKMSSAPATVTTLKPVNVPGLPKLGGMTVAQKGAMKEEETVEEAKKSSEAKPKMYSDTMKAGAKSRLENPEGKTPSWLTKAIKDQKQKMSEEKETRGKKVAGAILAKMRKKAGMEEESINERAGVAGSVTGMQQLQQRATQQQVQNILKTPNPNATAATGTVTTGAARIGPTGTKAVGATPLSDAPKARAVANMQQARQDVRTGGAPGAAADASANRRTFGQEFKTARASGAKTFTRMGKTYTTQLASSPAAKPAGSGSVVKGSDGVVRKQNFGAAQNESADE